MLEKRVVTHPSGDAVVFVESSRKEYLMQRVAFALVVASVVIAGCAPQPEEVAQQLIDAVNSQDIEGALALFAEDAVVNTGGPAALTGAAEIQIWLEELASANFEIQAEILEVNGSTVVEHDLMTMDLWDFYGISPLEGTTEYSVERGLVNSLEFTFSEEALAALQEAPTVSPEELIGTWRLGNVFLRLNEDGTARVVDRFEDLASPDDGSHPGSRMEWSHDGDVFAVRTIGDSVGEGYDTCKDGTSGIYFVKRVEADQIRFKVLQDSCPDRLVGLPWGPWRPHSP